MISAANNSLRFRVVIQPPNKPPPLLDIASLAKMPKEFLINMEKAYDEYVLKNEQVLLLNDLIEDYLDIRDAIAIYLQRLLREEQRQYFNRPQESVKEDKYYDMMLPYLEKSLQLTKEEKSKGYMPRPSEPKEYKCGCVTMCYYRNQSKKYGKEKNNIKKYYYCPNHEKMVIRKEHLESQLTKIKQELANSKKYINSLDYETYDRWIQGQPSNKCRYPWKQTAAAPTYM